MRDRLITDLRDARERTLALVADLTDAQLRVQYSPEVNPFLWELGHIAFFHDAFVRGWVDGAPPLLQRAERLYDSFRVDHADRWGLELPSRADTLAYMAQVAARVEERIGDEDPRVEYAVRLATLHEDMHGEAFAYMRNTLGYPAPGCAAAAGDAGGPLPGDVEVPGGAFWLGADPEGAEFVFDNEKWAHAVEVAPFSIARAPVTNAEFLAFVEDGGYDREELWSFDGWIWRAKAAVTAPAGWVRDEHEGWQRRRFGCTEALPLHQPVVHVAWHEAEAFCAWAGRRLPAEVEWEMAASLDPAIGRKRRYPWGDDPPGEDDARANLDLRRAGCVDVAAFPGGDSAVGCRQMLGNVWEWTSSAFYPFPGYVVDEPYREYSAPWFGDRKVLRGGAFATRGRLVHNVYRNFFTPDRRDVFAGFRTCAR